jgi:hypothetical protein
MNVEQSLGAAVMGGQDERTFTDKLLARAEANKLRKIIRKPKLSREDLLEILDIVAGVETKLVNYSDWERYVMCKYFVWIREVAKLVEMLIDYKERVDKKKGNAATVSKTGKVMLENALANMQHNIKFLVDLFLMLQRTTLSKNAMAFSKFLETKYEINYSGLNQHGGHIAPQVPQAQRMR